MAAISTSFKKKSSSKPDHPRGTRPSLHNAQLLVSSGVPSLDALLGGGIAVGSVLLIEEDVFNLYAQLVMKYFISEGVVSGHNIVLCTAGASPHNILQGLPGCHDDRHHGDNSTMPSLSEAAEFDELSRDEEMKIAWRYKNLPKVESSFSTEFGHLFDLTKKMDTERIQAVHTTLWNALEREVSERPENRCAELLKIVRESIEIQKLESAKKTVVRVAIMSLGSPLWGHDAGSTDTSLPRFLHSLRGLLRSSSAAAVVTMPTHLMEDHYVRRLERLCDGVVRIEAFAGSDKEQNPLYKEYHGLFHLIKLPRINSLVCHFPETCDLAFKQKRKRFTIEKLHLPPDLSETVSRAQEDQVPRIKSQNPPKQTTKRNIDF